MNIFNDILSESFQQLKTQYKEQLSYFSENFEVAYNLQLNLISSLNN